MESFLRKYRIDPAAALPTKSAILPIQPMASPDEEDLETQAEEKPLKRFKNLADCCEKQQRKYGKEIRSDFKRKFQATEEECDIAIKYAMEPNQRRKFERQFCSPVSAVSGSSPAATDVEGPL